MLAKLLNLTRPLTLLDLETTAIDPKEARVCSVGLRTHYPNGVITRYAALVNPGIPMPADALKSHGISDKMLQAAPSFSVVCAELLPPLEEVDYGGYNVRYDLKVLVEEFARHGVAFTPEKGFVLDALRLWQVLEPRTLSDAVEVFLKRPHKGAHDAVADIEETEEVLAAQLQHHPRSSLLPKTMEELHKLCFPRPSHFIDSEGKFVFKNGVPVFGFGKFRGQPLAANLSYLRWMMGADFPPEVKRIAMNAVAGVFPVEPPSES